MLLENGEFTKIHEDFLEQYDFFTGEQYSNGAFGVIFLVTKKSDPDTIYAAKIFRDNMSDNFLNEYYT